ncbi:MAG: hypothetical protein K9N51_01695 [Candidatus Pacebacteria bacterium]|nr:hypothetical protein [Candidatus Paceibacterota bacterium]
MHFDLRTPEHYLFRSSFFAIILAATVISRLYGGTVPVGYDEPASDRGGLRLKGGLQWIQEVFPRIIVFAEKPVWSPPTVFFITNYGGVDTIQELKRRFPMDVLHYHGMSINRQRFFELLNSREHIDCFVMSRFNTKSTPPDVQYEILRRVGDGAGFVMIDDFDRSSTLSPGYLDLKPETSGNRVFAGVPYDGLRQWVGTDPLNLNIMNFWCTPSLSRGAGVKPFTFSGVSVSPFGKGRVIWITTGTHWARRGRNGRTLLPHISQRRDMWVETDYYYSHTAKAILRACGIAQPTRIADVELAEAPRVMLETEDPFSGRLRWQARDTWGVISERGETAVTPNAGKTSVPLSDIALTDAGRYFVDVWLETDDGRTVDWGSGFKHVDHGVSPCEMTFKYPEGAPRGATLEGTVAVPESCPAARLRLELVDRYWRNVGTQSVAAKPGQTVAYRFPSEGLDGQIWTVKADLLDDRGHILSRAFQTVTSPHTPATRSGFHPTMTSVTGTNPEEAARAEYLRRLGFLANRPYGSGNPIIAESMAWRDVQLHPFAFRVTGASDDFNHDRICDWADPLVRRELAELHQTLTRLHRPFGLRGFNLTDDSKPRGNLPLGPYTVVAFHRWLEKEYGGLNETARAWGIKSSGFGRIHSWGRIHQASVKAWYDKGITAPWIDAQRFLQQHWVDVIVHVRDAVREVYPQAYVGSDAAYYENAASDLFGQVEYVAPYYGHGSVKLAVARGAARREGDFGACLGAYGGKPTRMTGRRSQIWDVLFAGGTGFYYWRFQDGLREDLTLSDAHALYQCEVVEELSDGIGELFTAGERIFNPIAILSSQTSGICDQLDDEGMGNSGGAFQNAMEDLGLNPFIITGEELAGGWLGEHGVRLLLLPGCNSLSDAEIETIRSFVDGGGIALADVRPGIRMPNGTPRKEVALDKVFGITVDSKDKATRSRGRLQGQPFGGGETLGFGDMLCDPRLSAAKSAQARAELVADSGGGEKDVTAHALFEHSFGKGRAYLLNASFSTYDTCRAEVGDTWRAWFRVMRSVTATAGLQPAFRGTSEGTETPRIRFSPFRAGAGWLLGVADLGGGDFQGDRRPFEVQLPTDCHQYDVRAGRYLSHGDVLRDELPRGGHRAYALLPYKLDGIDLTLNETELTAGELLEASVSLRAAATPTGPHVIRLTVETPDGRSFFPMKRVLRVPESGALTVPLRTAADDPPGAWSIEAVDVTTGMSTTVEFTLQGGAR